MWMAKVRQMLIGLDSSLKATVTLRVSSMSLRSLGLHHPTLGLVAMRAHCLVMWLAQENLYQTYSSGSTLPRMLMPLSQSGLMVVQELPPPSPTSSSIVLSGSLSKTSGLTRCIRVRRLGLRWPLWYTLTSQLVPASHGVDPCWLIWTQQQTNS